MTKSPVVGYQLSHLASWLMWSLEFLSLCRILYTHKYKMSFLCSAKSFNLHLSSFQVLTLLLSLVFYCILSYVSCPYQQFYFIELWKKERERESRESGCNKKYSELKWKSSFIFKLSWFIIIKQYSCPHIFDIYLWL